MVRSKRSNRKPLKVRWRPLSLRQKSRVIALVVGLLLISVGVNAAYKWHGVQHGGVPAGHTVATASTDQPSEQRPPSSYSVPADKPLSIQLPTIKAEGFIQQVGADKNNQMVVPSNVHMAGWYTKSVLPGANGLSIIDGHVNGLYAKGIFANLGKLKSDDAFTVTFGDKSVKNFKVKKVQTVSVKEADTALYVRDTSIAKQLNLITCGGKFNKADRTYDARIIIVAEGL
ncbi:class F sortase [Candidatus Saccharibacteria bacterium]|nr:MAG: class F sortase [Candidatus Saccharibacteria bacterium]